MTENYAEEPRRRIATEIARRSSGGLAKQSLLGLLTAAALAAGCHAIPAGTVRWYLDVGPLERTYLAYVPKSAPEGPLPVVFVFHGGGGTARQMVGMGAFTPVADRAGFILIHPDGVDRRWNDGRLSDPEDQEDDAPDDLAFVDAMLDTFVADGVVDAAGVRHTVDPGRIYATGISNGAMFSHCLAALRSDRFAAVAPVVGGLPVPLAESFAPARPVALLILQGTEDPLVPFAGGKIGFGWMRSRGEIVPTGTAVRRWVERNGCQPEPRTERVPDGDPEDGCQVMRDIYAAGEAGTAVELWTIRGGGHTWPSGPQYLPKWIIGPTCRDFDAATVIWEFFARHGRRDSAAAESR